MADYPDFMTEAELCREEKVPYTTYRYYADGNIVYHVVNRKVMVRVSDALVIINKIKAKRAVHRNLSSKDLFGPQTAA